MELTPRVQSIIASALFSTYFGLTELGEISEEAEKESNKDITEALRAILNNPDFPEVDNIVFDNDGMPLFDYPDPTFVEFYNR